MMTALLTDICLANLSLRDKEVARAYLNDGLSYQAVAKKFDLSVSQVWRIVLNAEKELADPLARLLFSSHLLNKHIEEFFKSVSAEDIKKLRKELKDGNA